MSERARAGLSKTRVDAGMSYYEELGVGPSASTEEIRQAYREMARVLHPDQQQDEILRRAAERQMKRLNAIVALLADPAERRRYDRTLAGGAGEGMVAGRLAAQAASAALPALHWAAETARRSWVWLVTAGLAGAGLATYLGTQTAGPAAPRMSATGVAPPKAEAKPAAPAAQPQRAKASPVAAEPERRRVVPQPPPSGEPREELARVPPPATGAELQAVGQAAPVEQTAPAAPQAPFEATVDARARAVVEKPPVANSLAGIWLYVPPRVAERAERLHPPEYIELRLIEERGVLYGRYRARYRVSDPGLWPEVNFEFEGNPEPGTYGWRGAGGARGDVRLNRMGADRLEVTWWTNKLAEQLSLASGTAVLVRAGTRRREEK
jgi:hypothetical protein